MEIAFYLAIIIITLPIIYLYLCMCTSTSLMNSGEVEHKCCNFALYLWIQHISEWSSQTIKQQPCILFFAIQVWVKNILSLLAYMETVILALCHHIVQNEYNSTFST